jgi:hypothetical protein
MQPVDAKELAVVAVVGFALAKLAERVPVLYSHPVIVPTVLYTLGYFLASRRPAEGYLQLPRN